MLTTNKSRALSLKRAGAESEKQLRIEAGNWDFPAIC